MLENTHHWYIHVAGIGYEEIIIIIYIYIYIYKSFDLNDMILKNTIPSKIICCRNLYCERFPGLS